MKKKEKVAIPAVFDNAIEALKSKIEKRYLLEKIINEKKKALEFNELKRDQVIIMEEKIKESIKLANKQREAKIKAEQREAYRDVQKKLAMKSHRIAELEQIEGQMLKRLEHSKNVHYQEQSAIQPYVELFEQRSGTKTVDDRNDPSALYTGKQVGNSNSASPFKKHSGLNKSFL